MLSVTPTVEMLQALFILPLETQRQTELVCLAQQELDSSFNLYNYQFRDSLEAKHLTSSHQEALKEVQGNLTQLRKLSAEQGEEEFVTQTQTQLKQILSFVKGLQSELQTLSSLLEQFTQDSVTYEQQVATSIQTVSSLLLKGLESFFPTFNHIVKDLFLLAAAITDSTRVFLLMAAKLRPNLALAKCFINLGTEASKPLLAAQSKLAKQSKNKALYERQLLWSVKLTRLSQVSEQSVVSQAFDYFVRREIMRKMKEEERDPDEQVFEVPFKIQEQIPPVVGKAMDEWTKEDVAKMEAEAEKAIEENFPSYYDEVQKTFFEAEYSREGQRMNNKEKQASFSKRQDDRNISLEEILQEILEVTNAEESRQSILKERLELVQVTLESDSLESTRRSLGVCSIADPMRKLDQHSTWQEDACSFLQQQLDATVKLKQIMNISEVNLARNYNFYHSPFPEEVKLILQPLQVLLMRLRDIVIRDEYESPLLNESMFLANYMLTCFNAEHTPLMKILMSIEFLLSKLEEWENTYASKRLNSVEAEINTLKQIVIRLRKIQILSWRNLLNWKKEQFVKEDFMNYVRLAHTLERQVFDSKLYKQKANEQSVEMKMFELLDLFMRDSTLGLYSGRLGLIKFLLSHFEYKQRAFYSGSQQPKVQQRLSKLVNALSFVFNYYAQFKGKLQQTVERLDGNAREKVRTLIDVSKWTVQKFSIIKNNIDKTHRQLYKACKDEEEALLQNVQTLVIASSRKKYANNDQMMNLDPELKTESAKLPCVTRVPSELVQQFNFLKSLQFLEETRIRSVWPTATVFEEAMGGFFERLADVRAVNKKHIQKRAFYDLLRYFKSQGIRSTVSEDVQSLLIESKVVDSLPDTTNYFYRAYETFLMLQNSSQVEGNNDFQNPDIRRVQGFSQNLMFKILSLNLHIKRISAKVEKLAQLVPTSLLNTTDKTDYLSLDRAESNKAKKLIQAVKLHLQQLVDKLQIQALQADAKRKVFLKQLIAQISNASESVPKSQLEAGFVEQLKASTEIVSGALQQLQIQSFASERDQLISNDSLKVLNELKQQVESLENKTCLDDSTQTKKLSNCETQIKVIYQDIVKALIAAEDQKAAGTRKSSLEIDTTNPTVIEQPDALELTMDQQLSFTHALAGDVFGSRLDKLTDSAQKLFDVPESLVVSGDQLKYTTALLAQLLGCLQTIVANQTHVMSRMSKFSYLTQRVFLYLIYQGFCGVDEPDDPEENMPSDLEEEDGCGLGDGGGGQQNITDQIEHEEQLEGLKNYESEDEKQEQDDVSKGDDDNDFDMKNDFDGQMDSDRDEENKHDEKDEEDEKDNVDDMLDNQLWDKNMEDMEKKEQEEQDQQKNENREVDLGEREIDKQNQVPNKEHDVAEGDFDQKEHDSSQEDDREDQEMAEAQSEGGERHESEGERSESEEGDDQVPLDKDSVKAESDEEFSSDGQSESERQSDAEKLSEQDQEAEGMEGSEHESLSEREEETPEDDMEVKPECNQAVLEDDQIQAKEDKQNKDDKQPNTQANLKKQEQANKEKSEVNQQENKQDNQSSSQVDPNGQDMLYQLTQKLQQRQQQKQQQPKTQPQQQEEAKQTIEQPNMKEQNQQEVQEEQMADEGEAMEYELDQNAQDLQGKLCTDQVENQDQAVDQDMEEDLEQMQPEQDQEEQQTNQKAETTGAQVKQAEMAKAEAGEKQQRVDEEMKQAEESKEELKDLIDEYMQYLTQKQELAMDVDDRQVQPDTAKASNFVQELAPFDLLEQKQAIRELFNSWIQNPELHRASIELLAKFKNQTQHVSASLCEQLRIILEPQLSQNLQGDFKTGKRLNMKKVISFIASHYRNDKIWLRRTLPSKRDYKILIAIDDTLSMKENNLGFFSLEAMIALTEALNKLEVGKVAVARIRDRMDLLHGFDDNYTSERAGFIVSQFEFAHCAQTSADHAMANFVCDANKLLDMQNHGGSAVNCPFVIVLSDGRFNKENVRRYIREAKEKRYLFIFIVLDKPKQMESGKTESTIMSLRSAVKNEQGSIKLVPYLKDFPFDYYCIVQDTQQLPNALGTILVQWYQMVAASGHK